MKFRTVFTVFFLAGALQAAAQSVTPWVLASAGSQGKVGDVTIMWTLGEFAVTTLENSSGYITQGFHQPPLGTTSAPYENPLNASIDVWPNPVTEALFVRVGEEFKTVEEVAMLDMLGRPLLSVAGKPGEVQVRLDVAGLPSGSYVMRIKAGEYQGSRVVTIQK